MQIIGRQILASLSEAARQSTRLRKNLNLHDSYDDPCQRLFNALEPGTYIRPHRHLVVPKPECFVGVRGRMALLLFDDGGEITKIVVFGPDEEVIGVDLPAGVWHSVVSLREGSVFFETKPGPFCPGTDKDAAPWAPEEGSSAARRYLDSLLARANEVT